MPAGQVDVFKIGEFTLDLERGLLLHAGEPARLRPKAQALLALLAGSMGRVVSKSELMDGLWPGIHVTEDSLTQSVRELRKTLGDDEQKFVRTVSKRGYMLNCRTEALPELMQDAPVVAVLRFRNDGRSDDAVLVDGFAEDIINGLARYGTVTVLARNSSFSFQSFSDDRHESIRSRIGADYIVEGSLRRHDGQLLGTVNLSDASNSAQLWGERFQISVSGMFSLEQDIVEQIVSRLATNLHAAGMKRALRKPAAGLAAYELVQKGVAVLRDPAASDMKTAEDLFMAAIERDESYGLAHIYLALSKVLVEEFGRAGPSVLRNAKETAERGIELAPDHATGHRVLALIRLYMREHAACEDHMRMALQLNPSDAESVGQMGYVLTMRGRPAEAMAWFDRAARLDPLHRRWLNFDRSMACYLLGEFKEAVSSLELSTKFTPWIRTRLAACHAQLGRLAEAREQLTELGKEAPEFAPLDYASSGIAFEHRADAEHFVNGVRLALGA